MINTVANIPPLFREVLSAAGMLAIDDWWTRLDEDSRSEALSLWRECNGTDSSVAVRVEARFVDNVEDGSEDFWHSDYYEYLVNHEVYLFQVPGIHICTRHPVARAAAIRGVIPSDFACPFASAGCPMRQLLGHSLGKSVRLRVSLTQQMNPPST